MWHALLLSFPSKFKARPRVCACTRVIAPDVAEEAHTWWRVTMARRISPSAPEMCACACARIPSAFVRDVRKRACVCTFLPTIAHARTHVQTQTHMTLVLVILGSIGQFHHLVRCRFLNVVQAPAHRPKTQNLSYITPSKWSVIQAPCPYTRCTSKDGGKGSLHSKLRIKEKVSSCDFVPASD